MREVHALAITSGACARRPKRPLDMTMVTRGKNDINTVRFLTQTARFVS